MSPQSEYTLQEKGNSIFRTGNILCFIFFFLLRQAVMAQEAGNDFRMPEAKRFIDKIEIFAGGGLAFNYGNKFLEHYKDDHVENRPMLKVGYSFGVGIYHPVSDRINIHGEFLFQQRGSKAQLTVPIYMGRLEVESEYFYNYHTVLLSPQVSIGRKKNVAVSLGGYYSIIQRVKGREFVYDTHDKTQSSGSFRGRSLRGLNDKGQIISLTFIPGLRSFEKNDYGLTLSCDYLIEVNENLISIKLVENLGLQNINKLTDGNLPEKNHSVSLIIGYILKLRKPRGGSLEMT